MKLRLLLNFSVIALGTSFLVFLAFCGYLFFYEDIEIEKYLRSYEQYAVRQYQLHPASMHSLGPYVKAYYGKSSLTAALIEKIPSEPNQVTRVDVHKKDGYMLFYNEFTDQQGRFIPLYMTINVRTVEFGDNNWDALLIISMLLMTFLIVILRFSLSRVLNSLMSPILSLDEQLSTSDHPEFSVKESATDEIKQLTRHLNSYRQMKERIAKQELMFANYASHELRTPITVIQGAVKLLEMNDKPEFQARQRERIAGATQRMKETISVLLNIVKQEHVDRPDFNIKIRESDLDLDACHHALAPDVVLSVNIAPDTELNLPRDVINLLLKNLVGNAIKFTHQGSILIDITSHRIAISDTGTGINEKALPEHGLGLLIVKRICDSFDWCFELKNKPDGGGAIAQLIKKESTD